MTVILTVGAGFPRLRDVSAATLAHRPLDV